MGLESGYYFEQQLFVYYSWLMVVWSIHRTTSRVVKKIEFFFCPFLSLCHPFPRHCFPQTKTIFFLSIQRLTVFFSLRQILSRNVFTRYGEGQQNYDTPDKGLRYISIRHGYQRSLEKYSHGREDWDTFGDPTVVGITWGLWGVSNRCNCAIHIPNTVTVLRRLCGSWRRGTHVSHRKTQRWRRDPWRVRHLTVQSWRKILTQVEKRLVCQFMDHSALWGPEKRWTYKGQVFGIGRSSHSWSIQGWIHSKRRNRLGQDLVARLVCTHTNLQLEHRLEFYETGMFPWDIEMTVEEPLSDDEDGVPHSVSDSESESDKDSD